MQKKLFRFFFRRAEHIPGICLKNMDRIHAPPAAGFRFPFP